MREIGRTVRAVRPISDGAAQAWPVICCLVVVYTSFEIVTPSGASSLPGRVEPKYSVIPSQANDARVSLAAVFTFVPRLTGASHGSVAVARVAA